jgi:hypothetical protein
MSVPRLRRAAAAVAALALALSALVTVGTAAGATVIDLQCTGSQTLGYSPGLTLTPQGVSVAGSGSFSCPVSTDPAISTGSFTVGPVTATLGCALTGGSGTFAYTWNTGQVSTVSATSVVTANLGVVAVTSTGTVVSGPFAGDTAVFTWTGTSPGVLDCLSATGVTQYAGPTTLTFTP